jgi:hypothetical protein
VFKAIDNEGASSRSTNRTLHVAAARRCSKLKGNKRKHCQAARKHATALVACAHVRDGTQRQACIGAADRVYTAAIGGKPAATSADLAPQRPPLLVLPFLLHRSVR